MLEIDLYRARIGNYFPKFSPKCRKNSKNYSDRLRLSELWMTLVVFHALVYFFLYSKPKSPCQLQQESFLELRYDMYFSVLYR